MNFTNLVHTTSAIAGIAMILMVSRALKQHLRTIVR